jgi:hypothetical protein
LSDGDIATINHLCVEISVLVFFPLNPQTGEFCFRNDCCDGGRMIAVGRGRALDVSGLANETFNCDCCAGGRSPLPGNLTPCRGVGVTSLGLPLICP